MLIHMDGFEQFSNMSLTQVNDELPAAGYTVTGTVAINNGRTSDTQAVVLGTSNAAGSIKRSFLSTAPLTVIGFAYMAETAREDIVSIANGFKLEWPDKIQINGAKGTVVPVLGVWYYYELVIDKEQNQIQVYINNVLDLSVPLPAAMTGLTTFDCTWAAPAKSVKRLDDLFVLNNGSGGAPVNRVGPQAITMRLPTIDFVKEWSPATGDDHFAMVDNLPPSETEFIKSSVSGAQDLFKAGATVGTGDITAVGVVVRARKNDIDARQMGVAIGPKGSTQKENLITNLDVEPKYFYSFFPTAPGNVAWDNTNLQDTPFGVIVRP